MYTASQFACMSNLNAEAECSTGMWYKSGNRISNIMNFYESLKLFFIWNSVKEIVCCRPFLIHWRWWQHVPLKYQDVISLWHSIISSRADTSVTSLQKPQSLVSLSHHMNVRHRTVLNMTAFKYLLAKKPNYLDAVYPHYESSGLNQSLGYRLLSLYEEAYCS
jgi:hypothetical protein